MLPDARTCKQKKGKDYAFQRQLNEKPGITPGCSGLYTHMQLLAL